MGTPIIVRDRALVQTTTTGTGTYQLGTAVAGYLALLAAGVANGDRVAYVVVDSLTAPTQFEVGEGVFSSGSPNTVTRALIKRTHTGGASAVNWAAGTKYLFLSPPSDRLPLLDTDGLLNPAWSVTGLQSQLRSAAAVAIGNNTLSVFPWDTNEVNSLGLIAGTPVGVLTIAVAGTYRFQANLHFPANPTGQRIMSLVVGGNTVRAQDRAVGNAAVPALLSCAWEAPLAAGTQFRVDVTQDSGAAMSVGGTTWSNCSVTRLG